MFFHTYVGAVYFVNGFGAVQSWISGLIDPTAQIPIPQAPQDGRMSGYQTQNQGGSSAYTSMNYSPMPPAGAPPPLPNSPSSSSTMPSSMGLVTLALVNQTATRKGLDINYIATQDGPSHQPTWTVRCTSKVPLTLLETCISKALAVSGTERGVGIAKSQKLAKEEAARRAWVEMGW